MQWNRLLNFFMHTDKILNRSEIGREWIRKQKQGDNWNIDVTKQLENRRSNLFVYSFFIYKKKKNFKSIHSQ